MIFKLAIKSIDVGSSNETVYNYLSAKNMTLGFCSLIRSRFNNGQYSGTTIYVAHQLDVRDGNYVLSTKVNSIFTIIINEISKLQNYQLVIGL